MKIQKSSNESLTRFQFISRDSYTISSKCRESLSRKCSFLIVLDERGAKSYSIFWRCGINELEISTYSSALVSSIYLAAKTFFFSTDISDDSFIHARYNVLFMSVLPSINISNVWLIGLTIFANYPDPLGSSTDNNFWFHFQRYLLQFL